MVESEFFPGFCRVRSHDCIVSLNWTVSGANQLGKAKSFVEFVLLTHRMIVG